MPRVPGLAQWWYSPNGVRNNVKVVGSVGGCTSQASPGSSGSPRRESLGKTYVIQVSGAMTSLARQFRQNGTKSARPRTPEGRKGWASDFLIQAQAVPPEGSPLQQHVERSGHASLISSGEPSKQGTQAPAKGRAHTQAITKSRMRRPESPHCATWKTSHRGLGLLDG